MVSEPKPKLHKMEAWKCLQNFSPKNEGGDHLVGIPKLGWEYYTEIYIKQIG
jgi:hypothetical protein